LIAMYDRFILGKAIFDAENGGKHPFQEGF
jgi:hypothetical protein